LLLWTVVAVAGRSIVTDQPLGALALSIWCGSFVPCMIRGIGDRGESMEV
jgi:hypothetical protein